MAIKLVKAKELVKADLIGKSDPYAVIRHGAQKYTTKVRDTMCIVYSALSVTTKIFWMITKYLLIHCHKIKK